MFKQFRYPSNRQALVVAVASAVLLLTLVVLWLALSTRTAVLSRQLEESDTRQDQLDQEVNAIWNELGEVTSAQQMNKRMREAGFVPAEGLEFLAQPTATTILSTTIPATPPVGGGDR